MSRPNKPGLEYFPLDCSMDDKTDLIEAKYGLVGFAVLIKLFQKIYSEGYFYKFGEEETLLFCKKINTDFNSVNDIVNDSLRWKLFNKSIYKRYGILTSSGIQKRYVNATNKRKNVLILEQLLLINIDEKQKHIQIVKGELIELKEEETPKKEEEIPQSKVKESILIPPLVPQGTNEEEPLEPEVEPELDINQQAKEIIDYLNYKTDKKFKATDASTKLIKGRLSEGFTVGDCKVVIDNKTMDWLNDPERNEYLRPDTLFRPTKFQGYLNKKSLPRQPSQPYNGPLGVELVTTEKAIRRDGY